METILLTGATGFLGSHLLEGLLSDNYRVIILKHTFSNTWRIKHVLSEVKFYDIDAESLDTAFKENKIEVVIHTATKYGKKGEDCAEIIKSNLLLPLKLIELSIFYDAESFFNTDSFYNRTNLTYKYLIPYSLSKKQFTEWLKLLIHKIQIVNLKLEHIYGPRDSVDKFVPWLIKKYLNNEQNINFSKGDQKRDFIYVSDVVNAFLLTLKKRRLLPGYSEFEVGTGTDISIRDFANKVKTVVSDISGKEVSTSLNFGAIPYREGEFMESKANNIALKQLGWYCSESLKEGLEKTVKELLNSRKAE